MLKGLIGSVIAVGLSSSPIINKPIDNSIVSPSTQAVVYDDNNNTITLTANEINTYSWSNLTDAIQDIRTDYTADTGNEYFTLNVGTFNYDSYENKTSSIRVIGGRDYPFIEFNIGNAPTINIQYNYNNQNEWNSNGLNGVIESDIVWSISSDYYTTIKSAIELDIQANQPADNNMPSVSDLFGYITQGVNAFIGSLGQAFESVVALFWDSSATTPGPTFLGLLMLISIGAGLIFLAYNVIKKLVYRVRG